MKQVVPRELLQQIRDATVEGDQDCCVELARRVLAEGLDPYQAVEEGFSQGMQIVGERFSRMEYYLPDLMQSADAMKAALEVLTPALRAGNGHTAQGVVVLGTIQGDLHDLGKNIVRTMLQSSGFTVHDLGADVPLRRFLDKAVELDADIIAASAILTTTMSYMPDLLRMLDELGLRERFAVMVGGAPVTREYAERAGADGYGETAAEAVAVAKAIMSNRRGGHIR